MHNLCGHLVKMEAQQENSFLYEFPGFRFLQKCLKCGAQGQENGGGHDSQG